MEADFHIHEKSLLIIFCRNPALGKVKTRLASTIGDEKALSVYLHLVAHTKSITEGLSIDKAVWYSDHVEIDDSWNDDLYKKYEQSGEDLGTRMVNAFRDGFAQHYDSICIIGTDCFELKSSIIEEAFTKLRTYDTVIGPAKDGGYYLLGMKVLHQQLFTNKMWSTDSIFEATVNDFKTLGLKYYELPLLADVDVLADIPLELREII